MSKNIHDLTPMGARDALAPLAEAYQRADRELGTYQKRLTHLKSRLAAMNGEMLAADDATHAQMAAERRQLVAEFQGLPDHIGQCVYNRAIAHLKLLAAQREANTARIAEIDQLIAPLAEQKAELIRDWEALADYGRELSKANSTEGLSYPQVKIHAEGAEYRAAAQSQRVEEMRALAGKTETLQRMKIGPLQIERAKCQRNIAAASARAQTGYKIKLEEAAKWHAAALARAEDAQSEAYSLVHGSYSQRPRASLRTSGLAG